MMLTKRSTTRTIATALTFGILAVACAGSESDSTQADVVGAPDTVSADSNGTQPVEVVDGAESESREATPPPNEIEPAATGPLTDFEFGGMTMSYDASYWRIETFGPDDPDDALMWFVSDESNAAIQLSFTNRALDPADDVCASGYSGGFDPARHSVSLLHEESLSNGGLLRIHRQDLDWRGDDAADGISFVQLTFNADDGVSVGSDYCRFLEWIHTTPQLRDDATPVVFRIEAFWAFSLDFIFAPFKEQFDSADALRQRDGFAEMLALLQTIELPGSPI